MRSLYLLLLVAPLAVYAVPVRDAEQAVHNTTAVDATSGGKNCHSVSPLASNLWYSSVVHDLVRLTSLVVVRCQANCNHNPFYCPSNLCACSATPPPPPPPENICVHNEDTHKCYSACGSGKFTMKGFDTAGKCEAKYSVLAKKEDTFACPDGGNIKYCPLTLVAIELETRAVGITEINAEQAVHNTTAGDATSGGKNCHSVSPLASNLWYSSVVHDLVRLTSLVVVRCQANCNHNPFYCPSNLCACSATPPPPPPPENICVHNEDTHKCYSACGSGKFTMKGFDTAGKCEAKYSVLAKKEDTFACPDGGNIKYCPLTLVAIELETRAVGL